MQIYKIILNFIYKDFKATRGYVYFSKNFFSSISGADTDHVKVVFYQGQIV